MIGGSVQGAGGSALGSHNADVKGLNELTMPGESRGLVTEGIRAQVAELTSLTAHARSRRPLHHVHADPPAGAAWTGGDWERYWARYEQEFGLARQPFSEAVHVKEGREHRHRVYSLVRPDGTCVGTSHSYQRQEKLSRLTEHQHGQAFTPGRHNRAVIHALDVESPDAAMALRAAGLHLSARPEARLTPAQRAQQERTGVLRDDLGRKVLAAWRQADSGEAFRAALAERGLTLAEGRKAVVVVDSAGSAHPLARLLGQFSKAEGGDRIGVAAARERLGGLTLPVHDPPPGGGGKPALPVVTHAGPDDARTAIVAAAQPSEAPVSPGRAQAAQQQPAPACSATVLMAGARQACVRSLRRATMARLVLRDKSSCRAARHDAGVPSCCVTPVSLGGVPLGRRRVVAARRR